MMKYYLRIYDNHYQKDESHAYNHGGYDTYEEAEIVARGIINEFLHFNWRQGMTGDVLFDLFCRNGETPVILPQVDGKGFNARDYVKKVSARICHELEG